MATFAQNIANGFLRVATEFKTIRTLITGSGTGDLSGLNTTTKTNLVAAINEAAAAGGAQNLDQLGDVTITAAADGQILRYDAASTAFLNVAGSTYFQPRDSDLDAIAALTTTGFGRGFLALADAAALTALIGAASETTPGAVEIATQAEVTAGTDDARAVTALKLAQRLTGFQPVDADLTALAALATTAYGRAFLTLADQTALMGLLRVASETATGVVELATAAETATGTDATRAVHPAGLAPLLAAKANTSALATVALSGKADDLTGMLPSAVLPPLAVNDTTVVATQAAMLALTAQRGDIAIRTDVGKTFILSTDSPGTLADWKEITAAGAVVSVAGKTGTVTLTKSDVGLANVDNTSDANKPISTATQTALNAKQALDTDLTAIAALVSAADRLPYATGAGTWDLATFTAFARTLVADADAASARATLGVYATTDIGDVNTDFAAGFAAALA